MSKKWFKLARKENFQWLSSIPFLPSCTGLLFTQSALIDSLQAGKKKPTAACWPVQRKGEGNKKKKKKKLGSTSLFSRFPLQTQQAFSGLPFLPDHSYGFGSTAPLSVSPSFEDSVRCWEEENRLEHDGSVPKQPSPANKHHWDSLSEEGGRRLFWNIYTKKSATSLFLHDAAPVIYLFQTGQLHWLIQPYLKNIKNYLHSLIQKIIWL